MASRPRNAGRTNESARVVLGDIPNVLPKTHQMVLNPFQGYHPDQCNLLDTVRLGETVKEFSTIDGAFLIRGDGVIVSVGAHIDSSLIVREHLPQGLELGTVPPRPLPP